MPLGATPMAYVLWKRWLKSNPHNRHWLNRDRFVLSAGQGSALRWRRPHSGRRLRPGQI
jgi:transketolase